MIARLKFRTEEARRRARIRLALKISFLSFGAVLFLGCVTFVCHHDLLRIKQIFVQTDGSLSNDELAATIKNELQGTYFGFLPKDSVFLNKIKSLETALHTQHPRIAKTNVQRAGFSTIHATVEERTPSALWCGDVVPPIAYEKTTEDMRTTEELWGNCYLIDKTGFIYANAPFFSGNMFPRYYGSLNTAEPIAQQYMPTDQFEAWQNFYTSLTHKDSVPQALLFVDERDIELYLTNGLRVLIPRDQTPEVILERLITLLESDTIDKDKKVNYIDLRFGNKVYVKYFEENKEESE
jgi:cell division septal protein FtsQ